MVDFARLNHIKHVIENDFDVRRDVEVESKALCVMRYQGTMMQILALPVPVRDEPPPVAGEIDCAAQSNRKGTRNMSWNQGNGNGQGNGYGQQQGYANAPQGGYGQEDQYDKFNNARQISNRDPYIEEGGPHLLAVLSIEKFPSQQGTAVRASFEVLESPVMRPGTRCGSVWFTDKPAPKPGMVTDSDRFADFCIRLKGAPAGYRIGDDIRALFTRQNEQLARGTVVRALGIKKIAKTTGKAFVEVHWSHVEQTPEQIVQRRQRIEAGNLIEKAPPPNAAPMTQQQAQGYAPPQAPPQQGFPPTAPVQYQQGQQLQPGPQGGYVPTQPTQAPQGAPQGGFLAQLPPQGGGQGGNGGGRW